MSVLKDQLTPDKLAEAPAQGVGGLTVVPLPNGRLPLSSLNEMVVAVVDALPLDDVGKEKMAQIEQAVGFDDLPYMGLHELEGLALTRLAFGDGCLLVTLDWSEASWDLGAGIVIGGPVLSVERTPGTWALAVAGSFHFGPIALAAELVLPELGTAAMSLSAGLSAPLLLGDLLAELHLDGSTLDTLQVTTLWLDLDIAPTEKHFHFAVEVGGGWHPFGEDKGPSLERLAFELDWRQGESVEGSFAASLGLGSKLRFDAQASWGAAGWDLSAELAAADEDDPPGIADLVHAATDAFGLSPVSDLPFDLDLLSAGVSLSTSSGLFRAWCDLEVGDHDDDGPQVGVSLDIQVQRDASGARSIEFGGQVRVGELSLDLLYSDGAFMAVFVDHHGYKVNLGELCGRLLELMGAEGVPDLPDVELGVREILFVALPPEDSAAGDDATPEDGAASTNPASTDATGTPPKKKRRALLIVDLDIGFRLGSLPLVGDVFGKDAELSIRFAPRYASQALSAQAIQDINGMLPEGARPLPELPIAEGAGFAAEVHVAGLVLTLPGEPDRKQMQAAASGAPVPVVRTGGPPDTHWIDIDKQLGPLSLKRLGLGIHDGDVSVLVDGGVALGPLQAAAMGLGFTYNLDSKHVTPQLDGLAIAMTAGAVSIKGGFLRTRSTKAGEGDCYAGMIDVTVSEIRVAALGLYQEVFGGPTFFIYGFVGFSAGLRPLITVDGIALGFGYGRRLKEVSLQELPSFPLVQMAMGEKDPPSVGEGGDNAAMQVLDTLASLQRFLPPERGGLVFAVGLKVGLLESFLTGFVLATVSLSVEHPEDFEIQIFGSVDATLPPKMPQGPWVARIELDLVARISPSKGELFIGLVVGEGSYVLDPKAKLTGGMAVAVWMSGDHAGDFVITLGGYAPTYKRPSHYPIVPRLGLAWSPSEALSIKGELYAAITPSVFMAGGRLSADFRSGKLHAWFDMGMDLLIKFKPFHYDFSAYLAIGFRYGSIGMTLSANLHIWGPDFSGHAHIKIHILFFSVSFSVSFGAGAHAPPPLTWDAFVEGFLPPVDKRCVLSVPSGAYDVLEGKRVDDALTGSDGRHYLVDPQTLELHLSSAVPLGASVNLPPMCDGNDKEKPKAQFTGLEPLITVYRETDAGRVAVPGITWTSTRPTGFATAIWSDPDQVGETAKLVSGRTSIIQDDRHPTASQTLNTDGLGFVVYKVLGTAAAPPIIGPPVFAGSSADSAPMTATLTSDSVRDDRAAALQALGLDTRDHRVLDGALKGRGRRRQPSIHRSVS